MKPFPHSNRQNAAFIASLLTLFAVALLQGYVLMGHKWNNGSIVMNLHLGAPSGALIDGTTSWNTVSEHAMSDWNSKLQNVQFTVIRNSTNPIGDGDGRNSVFWSNTVFGRSFGSTILAVATTWRTGTVRTESDIVFNNTKKWNSYRGDVVTANGGGWLNDLRRVANHELGHTLGLDHPDEYGQSVEAVMNSIIGDLDHLADDDITGGQYLYGMRAPPVPAEITSPDPSFTSTLPTSSTTFRWSASSGATSYRLDIGTTARGSNIYKGIASLSRAAVVNTPGRGADLYLTLYTTIGATNYYNEFQFSDYTNPWSVSSPVGFSTTGEVAYTNGSVWYRGSTGALYYLDLWSGTNRQVPGAIVAAGSSLAYDQGRNWLWYRGSNNVLYYAFYDGSTFTNRATTAAIVGGSISVNNNTGLVWFRGTDNKLYRTFIQNSRWTTAAAATPLVGGALSVDSTNNLTWFAGLDKRLYVTFFNGTTWSAAAVPGASVGGAVAADADGKLCWYKGADNRLYVVWRGTTNWQTAAISGTSVASSITIGSAYSGDGRVWFRGNDNRMFSVELIDGAWQAWPITSAMVWGNIAYDGSGLVFRDTANRLRQLSK
jgi:hypothetical protein